MRELSDPAQRPATFPSVLLALLVGALLLATVILAVVTGWLIFLPVAIVLFVLFHYFLWGRAMNQEAAAERQHLEALDQAKESLTRSNNWTYRR
jgi:hypothetical protein